MLRRLILVAIVAAIVAEPVYRVGYPNNNAIGNECKNNACATITTTTATVNDNHDDNSFDNSNNDIRERGNDTNLESDDLVEEGRGKKGKKGGYGKIIFAMAGVMKATMLYLMIHAVAALAGKALIVAKVALAIATAVGLKKALEHNDKTSYEIVKHPHHSYVQTHSTSVDYDHHHGGYEGGHRRRKRRAR